MVACRHRWFFPMEQTLGRAVQPWKLVVGHGGLVDHFREAVGASLGIPGCREELKEKSPRNGCAKGLNKNGWGRDIDRGYPFMGH